MNLDPADNVYSILQINTAVSELLKAGFPGAVWVHGEIQGFRPDRNKRHIYFDLVQKDEKKDNVVAKVKAALFANRQPQITRRILSTNGKFDLKNDIEVKFLCEVSLHAPTGNYSLVIVDVDPVYTIGKMAQTRQNIINELNRLGIMDNNKQVELPLLPLRIGLITAFDSAAYHDFVNELEQSNYPFKVSVINAHMQGKDVEKDISTALKYFNSLKQNKPDMIVITRGGGAVSDLAWFDNLLIAKTIASLDIPVISALGHQIDLTVTDIVSNITAKTPTKAASFIVDILKEQEDYIDNLAVNIKDNATNKLEIIKRDLELIVRKIDSAVPETLKVFHDRLLTLFHKIIAMPQRKVLIESERLNFLENRIKQIKDISFKNQKEKLKNYKNMINSFDPRLLLGRGYTITKFKNKLLKSPEVLNEGDEITTCFSNGEIISEVKKSMEVHNG